MTGAGRTAAYSDVMRSFPLLALPVLAIALLAGCSAQSEPPAGTPAPTSAAPTVPPAESPAPSPTAAPQVDPNAPAGQCADANLTVTVVPDEGGAGAGSSVSSVVFTNTGDACVLEGAPGVSVVGGGNGTQIGVPAEQSGAPVAVAIPAGGSAHATLSSINIGSGGGPLGADCAVTTGDGYRVYPPHSFEAFFVPLAGVAACSSDSVFLQIGVVEAA